MALFVRLGVLLGLVLMLSACATLSSSNYRTFKVAGEPSGEYQDLPLRGITDLH